MKKILFLTLLLFLTACGKSEKVFSKLPSDAVIMAFGDSLTYGTGADKTQSYPSVLAKLSSHTVINSGIPGEISADGLKRLPTLLDEQQPQLLILIHGANDILRNMPREQTATNLTRMIAEAKQRDIKVVMLGVPVGLYSLLGLTSLESAKIYQQVAEAEKVPIDLESLPAIIENRKLKSDKVHPNGQGYQRLGEAVFKLLQETGAL